MDWKIIPKLDYTMAQTFGISECGQEVMEVNCVPLWNILNFNPYLQKQLCLIYIQMELIYIGHGTEPLCIVKPTQTHL